MLNKVELAETIQACRRQDRHAQNRLYRAFHAWAWSVCSRYTQDDETAYECVQDGFFKVFTKIDRYGGELSFEAWFKKILINTCIDRHRSRLREQETVELEAADQYGEIAEALINADAEYLLYLIKQLPPAYQTVFSLYAVEGYDYQEIADLLQINIGSVKSNLSKARAKLRQMLSQNQQERAYGR